MANNTKLIAEIEALLAAAKSYDKVDLSSDRVARLDLLAKVEALHYELDDPADAMFRQIMNVRNDMPFYSYSVIRSLSHGLTALASSTQKPLPSIPCCKWASWTRYHGKEVCLPRGLPPVLRQTRKSLVSQCLDFFVGKAKYLPTSSPVAHVEWHRHSQSGGRGCLRSYSIFSGLHRRRRSRFFYAMARLRLT